MRISLNGHVYELAPGTGVQREPIVEFPGNVRQQGQQERQDRALMSSWVFNDFTFGGGVERMDVDDQRSTASYWRSTVDTRWKGKVFLPAKVHTCTFGSTSHTNAGLNVFEDLSDVILVGRIPSIANNMDYGLLEYTPATDKFDYLSRPVPDGSTYNFLGIAQADYDSDENRYWYWTVGASGQATHSGITFIDRGIAANVPTTVASRRLLAYGSMGQIECAPFHKHIGTMHLGVLNIVMGGTLGRKAFIHPIMTGTYEYAEKIFQHDYHKPPHLAHTLEGLYAGTSRGVFLLNLVQKTYTEKVNLGYNKSKYNAVDMCAWGNEYLMVPYRDEGGIGGLLAYNTVDESSMKVGMDLDDGVPSGWSSEISSLLPTPDFIFAAHARPLASYPDNRFGSPRMMAYDGYGWHFIGVVPTMDDGATIKRLLTSDKSDGIPRLWMMPTGSGYCPWYLKYPLTYPLTQKGYVFATEGDLEYPIFNGGMPEFKGGFYDWIIEANTLGSGRLIEAYYGLDGAVPSTLLGIATQSGTRVMQFGSGLGVEAYSVQMRLRLLRGPDEALSPVLVTHHSPVLHYIKYPSKRETFKFAVDLEATTKGTRKPPKRQMDELLAVATMAVMVPFFYGHIGTKNVKLLTLSHTGVSDDLIFAGDPAGQVEVMLAELL